MGAVVVFYTLYKAITADLAEVSKPTLAAAHSAPTLNPARASALSAAELSMELSASVNKKRRLSSREFMQQQDDDWAESTDPTSGRKYYYNQKTQETKWEKPN